ncbi:MAG TPA: hypothetical protein VFZ56_02360 [Gemmatimonadaceae bacterium]
MLKRLFPTQVDNRFSGHRAALWLLGLFVGLKLVMSINSMLNTASIATGDGLPLDSYGPAAARVVLMLFSLSALGQLALAAIALAVLIRYRAMVPFIFLVLLGEQLARRVIVQSYAVPRTETGPVIWFLTFGLVGLLALGLVLSLLPARERPSIHAAA